MYVVLYYNVTGAILNGKQMAVDLRWRETESWGERVYCGCGVIRGSESSYRVYVTSYLGAMIVRAVVRAVGDGECSSGKWADQVSVGWERWHNVGLGQAVAVYKAL